MADCARFPSGDRDRQHHGAVQRPIDPARGGADGAHSIVALQRLAGNDATRMLIQRLDDEDADTLAEAARFIANPIAYAGEKAGKWAKEKAGEAIAGQQDWDSTLEPLGGGGHTWTEDEVVVAGRDSTLEPLGGGGHTWTEDEVVVAGPAAKGGAPAKGGSAERAGGPDETIGADPLVGLRRGDGLDVGTWRRRPRVKLLQYRLNEVAAAGIKVDGMWGKGTSGALEAFQLGRGLVPEPNVDAATSSALLGAAPGSGEAPGSAEAPGGGAAQPLPDISGLVAPDVLARWQGPLAAAPTAPLPGGPGGGAPSGPAPGGSMGGLTLTSASGFAGTPGAAGGTTGAGLGGDAAAASSGIRIDQETLARFEQHKAVLYDMWNRYDRAYKDTQAYLGLLQQSAAAAGYWASRAYSSICASLAGIVLGPPGVALWALANQFWGLGARMAEETQRPILEAAAWPAIDNLRVFGNIVQESFNQAYPMQTPDMPWYVVGAGWIQPPTSALLNAYGQVQRLGRR